MLVGTALGLALVAWNPTPSFAQHHGGGHGGSGGGHGGWGGGHGGGYGGYGGYGSGLWIGGNNWGVGIGNGWGHSGYGGYGGYPYYSGYNSYGSGYYGSYPYYSSYSYPSYSYSSYPSYTYSSPSYDTYSYTPSYTTTPSYQSNYYTPSQQQPAGPTMTVTINDSGFAPSNLDIKVGTTVVWVNNSQNMHGLAQPHRNWTSPNIANGQTYSWSFSQAGTYELSDTINPSLKMTIQVR